MKVNEMSQTIEKLRKAAAVIADTADWLAEQFGGNISLTAETPKPKKEEPKITLEEVRAALAEKSRAGFTAEVKALITKYGATKLSGVSSEHYAELLKDAEVIGNAG